MSRLVLGTVQLGTEYGIANSEGKPDQGKAERIINAALDNGIVEFDTAQGYGNSEEVLGKAFTALNAHERIRVITKTDPALDHENENSITRAIEKSFEKLRIPQLWGLLIHHEKHLSSWHRGLYSVLRKYTEKGIIKHLGVSVYSVEKALEALDTEGISIIQLPTNVLDRRFENAGVFEIADRKGIQIYIRSVFLQGLLLMEPVKISHTMEFAIPIIKQYRELCKKYELTPHEIAMCYVKQIAPHVKLLFGAENVQQVRHNIKLLDNEISISCINEIRNMFQKIDMKILNPSLWGK